MSFRTLKEKFLLYFTVLSYHARVRRIKTYAAASSFYTLFSLAPALFLMLEFIAFFASPEFIQQIMDVLLGSLGETTRSFIESILLEVVQTRGFLLVVSVIALLVTATNGFAFLKKATLLVWGHKIERRSIFREIKNRLFALLLISVFPALVVAMLLLTLVVEKLGPLMTVFTFLVDPAIFSRIATIVLGLATYTLLFLTLPRKEISFPTALKAGAFSTLLFSLGNLLLSLYLSNNTLLSFYGVLSTVFIFLLWVYYSTYLFFLGVIMVKIASDEKSLKQAYEEIKNKE